jgi:hypothetical protein
MGRAKVKAGAFVTFALAVVLSSVLSGAAHGALPQPIYFFTDTATLINHNNPLVIKPSGFLMFQDGQWVLQDLHWTGWGSPVARARGISNSSNDIPDAAQGKRIKTPAQVTLSSPGRFRGHEVYRCFTLTVPASPASNQHLCLARFGRTWLLQPTALHLGDFLSPDRQVWCGVGSTQAFCVTGHGDPSNPNAPQRGGTVTSTGKVTTCYVPVPSLSSVCTQNWDASAPVLRYGQETELDGFRCTSAQNGITCIFIGANKGYGKGFRVSATEAVAVGP